MENNWCIKGCKELGEYIKSLPKKQIIYGDRTEYYYYLENNNYWSGSTRKDADKKVITFQQFLEMNKKPIGYIVKEEYKEVAAKVLGVTTRSFCGKYHFRPNSCTYNNLQDCQVLDIWCSPVYEEVQSFKVGDIVVVKNYTKQDIVGQREFTIGEVFKIDKIDDSGHDFIGKWVVTEPPTKKSISINSIRLATPEEIEQYNNKPKQFNVRHLCDILIVEVSKKGIYVPSQNMWINEHDLYRIINMTKIKLQYTSNPDNFTGMEWEVSLNTINIGCKKDVSVQDLIPVMEYYDSIQ